MKYSNPRRTHTIFYELFIAPKENSILFITPTVKLFQPCRAGVILHESF